MDGLRALGGHVEQGAVALVALSDWRPGAGGTCVVRGSHRWVRAKLRGGPVPHAALNRWAIDEVAARRADGSLRLAHEAGGGGVIEQLVAKAGDVVLMHPWTVHSGTGGRADSLLVGFPSRRRRPHANAAKNGRRRGRCSFL